MSRFDLLIFEDAQQMFERRAREEKERQKRFVEIEEAGCCEGLEGPCDCKDKLWWYSPRSFYPWDKDKDPYDDPNRKLFLCRNCGEAMEAFWADQWGEYYSGCL